MRVLKILLVVCALNTTLFYRGCTRESKHEPVSSTDFEIGALSTSCTVTTRGRMHRAAVADAFPAQFVINMLATPLLLYLFCRTFLYRHIRRHPRLFGTALTTTYLVHQSALFCHTVCAYLVVIPIWHFLWAVRDLWSFGPISLGYVSRSYFLLLLTVIYGILFLFHLPFRRLFCRANRNNR